MAVDQVLVLGAGIQGVCVSLALQAKGYHVTLIDQAGGCMEAASAVNEGKIHLGHVYANDASFQTAALMLRAAMNFAPLIEQWLGVADGWRGFRSRPFKYAVMKDSMLPATRLLNHYQQLQTEYLRLLEDHRIHYLGERPSVMWQAGVFPGELNPDQVETVIDTPEIAVDVERLRQYMRPRMEAIASIETLYNHTVASVSRTPEGFRVDGVTREGKTWNRRTSVVVNCLWAGRLKIDQGMGITPGRRWLYRLKYRVLADLPSHLRGMSSFTLALGPYGDIVTHPGSETAYLSWYPCCMQGSSADLLPPPQWQQAGSDSGDEAAQGITRGITRGIAQATLAAFDAIIPGIGNSKVRSVNAGVIFSWGETDIDDINSELHHRYNIGVEDHDGYYSINTGKFTCHSISSNQMGMCPPSCVCSTSSWTQVAITS